MHIGKLRNDSPINFKQYYSILLQQNNLKMKIFASHTEYCLFFLSKWECDDGAFWRKTEEMKNFLLFISVFFFTKKIIHKILFRHNSARFFYSFVFSRSCTTYILVTQFQACWSRTEKIQKLYNNIYRIAHNQQPVSIWITDMLSILEELFSLDLNLITVHQWEIYFTHTWCTHVGIFIPEMTLNIE